MGCCGNFMKSSKDIKITTIPATCDTVLCLPQRLASRTSPDFKTYSLRPVIMNSLSIITATIQAFTTILSCKNAKKTPIIRILSAIGSSNFPRSDIRLWRLANIPSSKSVREAMIKIMNAMKIELKSLCSINPIQKNARIILKNVR